MKCDCFAIVANRLKRYFMEIPLCAYTRTRTYTCVYVYAYDNCFAIACADARRHLRHMRAVAIKGIATVQ